MTTILLNTLWNKEAPAIFSSLSSRKDQDPQLAVNVRINKMIVKAIDTTPLTQIELNQIQEALNYTLSKVTILRIYNNGGIFPSANLAVRKAAKSLGLPLPPVLTPQPRSAK